MCVSVNHTRQHVYPPRNNRFCCPSPPPSHPAHLAVEHLISRNVVQLHSEKVIPGEGKQRATVRVAFCQRGVWGAAGGAGESGRPPKDSLYIEGGKQRWLGKRARMMALFNTADP